MTGHYAKHIKGDVNGYIDMVKERVYTPVATLEATAYMTKEPVAFENRLSGEYKKINIGEKWGKDVFDCAWFHVTGQVPQLAEGKDVVLLLDLNGEGLIYDNHGCPIRGITNINSSFDFSLGKPGKRVVQFANPSKGNETVDIYIDAGYNDLFGRVQGGGVLKQLDIAVCNNLARDLYYDMVVLNSLLNCVSEKHSRYFEVLYALNDVCNIFTSFSDEELQKARDILKPVLDKKGGDSSLTFSAIGHAHLDLAWLWPIRETMRKGARTFSTAIELLDRYPDYVFGASQAQLYDWIKQQHPKLYEKIKEKVAEGRWDVQGGMWVESDTNVPSGESLIRQFLYGKRFFKQEFNQDMKILWLPDVFGYSAALPQIMKKSGVDYFTTIKLSWNRVNKFPYHTFNWEGLDKSEVLVHMPPEGTYNSAALPEKFALAEENFQDKGLSDMALTMFGIGDGGGGPGPEHLERLKRIENLSGISPVKQQKSLDFFEHIAKDKDKYNKHKGELYMEAHQGTLTTQAKNKYYNRKIENMLHQIEALFSLAYIKTGLEYPREVLNKIWHEILLYQFHDIIPGSSIKRVHDESVERYEIIEKQLNDLQQVAVDNLRTKNDGVSVCNMLSFEVNDFIKVSDKYIKTTALPMGISAVKEQPIDTSCLVSENDVLENNKLKVVFNQDGSIKSLITKENGREVARDCFGLNQLVVHTDFGDCWDFKINYRQKPTFKFELQNVETFIDGVNAVRKCEYAFGNSKLIQNVVLAVDKGYVDFQTFVDWNEKDKMLRAEFPLNINSTQVGCDIQFGHINRSTTNNTNWDYAQVEIAAHKFIDISEADFGVALLNDCKYGYYAKENLISINLLRSANYPGESADIGTHNFSYALYPHNNTLANSDVQKVGYLYNNPLTVLSGEYDSTRLVTSNKENIVVETIKMAEDSNDIIVRVYENQGKTTNGELTIHFDGKGVELTNMIEDKIKDLEFNNNKFIIKFIPFEVHTFKVKS